MAHDWIMLEGAAVMILTLLITLVVALTVMIGLALVRRPAAQWQDHLREQNARIHEARNTPAQPDAEVDPTQTTLTNLMAVSATDASAYFDADRLPGVDRIEQVTDRFEALQAAKRANGR